MSNADYIGGILLRRGQGGDTPPMLPPAGPLIGGRAFD
jgi:hypothetical protein